MAKTKQETRKTLKDFKGKKEKVIFDLSRKIMKEDIGKTFFLYNGKYVVELFVKPSMAVTTSKLGRPKHCFGEFVETRKSIVKHSSKKIKQDFAKK